MSTPPKQSQEIAVRLSKSAAMQKVAPLNADEWAGILAELDEKRIQDFVLLLDEEDSGRKNISDKALRRKVRNQTSFLQKLEKMKLQAEIPDDNQKND